MAGSLSNYASSKLLGHIIGKTAYTMPAFYLAASTTAPGEDGSTITEPVGMGYARVLTSGADWNAPTVANPSVTTNAAEITFATASGTWGTMAYGGGFDALTGGNMTAHANFDTSRAIASGDALVFPIGSITITMA